MAAGWIETQRGPLCKFKETLCLTACSGTLQKKSNMFGNIRDPSNLSEIKV